MNFYRFGISLGFVCVCEWYSLLLSHWHRFWLNINRDSSLVFFHHSWINVWILMGDTKRITNSTHTQLHIPSMRNSKQIRHIALGARRTSCSIASILMTLESSAGECVSPSSKLLSIYFSILSVRLIIIHNIFMLYSSIPHIGHFHPYFSTFIDCALTFTYSI